MRLTALRNCSLLLQNYGDRMARARLDASANVRTAFPIRATLLSSGEDQPKGEASTLARILSVNLPKGSVNRQLLTKLQQSGSLLQLVTSAYLRWRAAHPERLRGNREHHATMRRIVLRQLEGSIDHATNPGRVASNMVTLYVAWHTFTEFLETEGHWNLERSADWLLQGGQQLGTLARRQVELTTTERYSQLFLETVRGLVASGKAVIQNLAETPTELRPGQVLIGGRNKEDVYLIISAAYDLVTTRLRSAGQVITFSQGALSQMLKHDGVLRSSEESRVVVFQRISGVATRCRHLDPEAVFPER